MFHYEMDGALNDNRAEGPDQTFSRLTSPCVEPDPEFDHVAGLAAALCATPFAAVTLFRNGLQWIKGSKGVKRIAIPAERSFCIHTLRQGEMLEIRDATRDPRTMDNDLVTGEAHFRFYVGIPLIAADGRALGALCVVDTEPRPDGLDAEQKRALDLLARQASLQLKLQDALAERDCIARDLKAAVADLRWAANHDVMTGLGNRAMLREAIAGVSGERAPVALLAIDVDHFKRVNDSFGHQAGDEVIKEIARRLTSCVRSDDVVIRLGGDEFAIIARNCHEMSEISGLANRLLEAMQTPVLYDGRALECRITIGSARAPQDTETPADLVVFADAALCEAKARGRGRYLPFEEGFLAERSRRLSQIARAQAALAEGRIVPFYQPKVDLADGSVYGLEALLRIADGDSFRLPEEIAAAFAEADLAQAIGGCMLRQVLRDMQAWTRAGISFGRVAVNMSATEVADPTFAGRLLETLAEHGIAPSELEIEIIEDVLLDERSGAVLKSIQSLSKAGISIAFDDFGTGYAALAHLPSFPVDVLKLDRSFVEQLDLRANQAIVGAILSLASELDIEVVAEGVETIEQSAELLRLGCTRGQGFLYSEAVPAEQVAAMAPPSPMKRPDRRRPVVFGGRLQNAPRAA